MSDAGGKHLKPSGPSSNSSGSILFLLLTGRRSFLNPGSSARAGASGWQEKSPTPRHENAARLENLHDSLRVGSADGVQRMLRLSLCVAHGCPAQAPICVRFAVLGAPLRQRRRSGQPQRPLELINNALARVSMRTGACCDARECQSDATHRMLRLGQRAQDIFSERDPLDAILSFQFIQELLVSC